MSVSPARAPDYAEAIGAWRLWLPVETPEGIRLRSLFHDTVWPPRVPLRATCLAPRGAWPLGRLGRRRAAGHEAPEARCTCGLYAAHPDLLLEHLAAEPARYVVGRVFLWGRVVECERGWRAELAYPAHLYVAASARDVGRRCAALAVYGVPVEEAEGASLERLLPAA
jgi:hypothetical protein